MYRPTPRPQSGIAVTPNRVSVVGPDKTELENLWKYFISVSYPQTTIRFDLCNGIRY